MNGKKMFVLVIVAMMVGAILGGLLVKTNEPKGEMYAMTTVVVDVNYDLDEVTCLDFNGNEWVFLGCEDWMVGDIASLLMDDCGTATIYDDEIVSARYNGWVDGYWGFDNETYIADFSCEK